MSARNAAKVWQLAISYSTPRSIPAAALQLRQQFRHFRILALL